METTISHAVPGATRRALGASLALTTLLALTAALSSCGSKPADSTKSTPPAAGSTDPGPSAGATDTSAASLTSGTPQERGKALFARCIQCHKADGSGGVKLTGNPSPSWTDKARMATVTDADLHDCIYNGKLASGMVAWGKSGQLSEAQIADLIAHIRTFSK